MAFRRLRFRRPLNARRPRTLGLIVERVCHRGQRNLTAAIAILGLLLVLYGLLAIVSGFAAGGLIVGALGLVTFVCGRWARGKLFVEIGAEPGRLRVSGPFTGEKRIDLSKPGVRLDDGFLSRNHAPRLHTSGEVVTLTALSRSYDSLNLGPDPAVNNMIARIRLEISLAQREQ